ncbi:MAG: transporter related [Solirubrobacterales bacterium]|nr:transporter related [Solirubrobacterales bacterium]
MSLRAQDGELIAVLGINGSGKTTLLRLLAGRLVPDAGTASVAGHDVVGDRRALGAVCGAALSTEMAWYRRLDALTNLETFGTAQGLDRRAARAAAVARLADLGLEPHARRPVQELSVGMRARLAIARALLADPAVLLLDEPTAGLDPEAAESVLAHCRAQPGRRTVVMATHSISETTAHADRASVMRAGRVVAELRRPIDGERIEHLLRERPAA